MSIMNTPTNSPNPLSFWANVTEEGCAQLGEAIELLRLENQNLTLTDIEKKVKQIFTELDNSGQVITAGVIVDEFHRR